MRKNTILRSSRARRDMAWPMMVAASLPMAAPLPAHAQALPTGAAVTAGRATITTPTAHSLVVRQDTQRAVVNWSSFNIAQGNTVNFAQPNAGAATLNVVKGAAPTDISGTLKANGSVFLINQNGIAISSTGVVDTRAGFVASTLGMSEDDFMAGRNVFSGKGGAVVNRGQIVTGPGGTVALLGSSVGNDGVISAPLGKVALGAAQAATLDLSGDGYLQVLLPADAKTADGQALVGNQGVIDADGGVVMLKASTVRDALREAVNMPGTIRARSVSGVDGAIVLEGGEGGAVRVSGTLDVSAAQGGAGRIDVGGQTVALAGATLDASGAARGGLVRVGGSFQGGKAQPADADDVQRAIGRFGAVGAAPGNAATTTIDAASHIDVSAHGAAGEGGSVVVWSDKSTTMRGSIAAGGARAAGAVEVSSGSTVQSVALDRIALGKGGRLLLDPQDIQIDDTPGGVAGSIGYGDNPGGVSHLYSADLVALLGSGTSVSLKASQDIEWNTFNAVVTRPANRAAGALALAAGRSVTLNGVFGTADADWSIVANDTAAHGVVDGERGAGAAQINLGGANFINSNGKLTLTLSDGAGNTERDAGGIFLGGYRGNGLSAAVAPGAASAGMAPYITLTGDVTVAGDITLTGNLSVSAASATLSANRVNWTTEATSALRGEGAFKFVENGTITRLGRLNGGQPTRLALGDGVDAGISRVYGDADPAAASLGTPLLHVTSGTASDALDDILAAGSLATSGPGVTAGAGSHTLSLGGSAVPAFNAGLSGGYFIDMTPVALPLTVTRRTVTPTVGAVQGTYGTAASVVTLSNVVNGDALAVQATLNGGAAQTLAAVGAGFGFGERTAAGNWNYAVTGLSGAAAGNYTLAAGPWTGTLAVAPKTISYSTAHSTTLTYGDTGYEITGLAGVLAGDDVAPVATITSGGAPVPAGRLKVGSYDYVVSGLSGADAANYRIGGGGNQDTPFTVVPRVLDYSVAAANATYGTAGALGAVTLNNVLPGDAVAAGAVGIDVNGARQTGTTTATTPAGAYAQSIASLSGADAANYTLTGSHPGAAMVVAPKALHWAGATATQEYGQDLPAPALVGVVNGDDVTGVTQIVRQTVTGDPSPSRKPSVGQYELALGGLRGTGAGNYTLDPYDNRNAVITVAPKAVTYAAGSLDLTYGDGGTVPGVTLSGVLAGDSFDVRTYVPGLTGFGSTAIDARAPAGTYSVFGNWIPHNGDNYVLAGAGNTNGTLTIARRPITWTVGSGTALYGNAPGNPVTLTGALQGDDVTPQVQALDGHGAGIALPGVGTYTAAVTGFGGAQGANYTSAATGNVTGQLTISPKPLSLVVNSSQSVYGTLGAPAVTLDGLVPGDTLGVHTQVAVLQGGSTVALTDRTPVGSYTVQATAQVDNNPNYTLLNNTGTATLTVKPKVLTYTGPTGTYEYGAVVNGVDLHNTLNGVLAGDDVTLPIILQGGWTNTVAKRQVGDYPFPVSLVLGLTGRDAGNYSVTSVGSSDGLIRIVPKTITYKTWFADSAPRQYGDVRDQVDIRSDFTGLAFADDRVALGAASLVGATYSSGGYLNAGTYATQVAGLSGPDAGNYRLAAAGNEIASLTVLPRAVAPTWSLLSLGGIDMGSKQVNSLVYGSTGGAHVAMTGFAPLAGDKASLTGQIQLPGGAVAALDGRQAVGSYLVTAALGGQDAANYYVRDAGVDGAVGRIDITPRPLGATYKDWHDTYGITPQLDATLDGVLPGDTVRATGQLLDGAGNPVDVGIHTPAGSYTYRATGLAGSAAGNYTLARAATSWLDSASGMTFSVGPSNTARVQVDKARLTVSYTGPTDMVYGTNPTRPTVTGFVAGDAQDWLAWLTTTGSPTPGDVGKSFNLGSKAYLPAGTYDFSIQLDAATARNYEQPAKLPALTVARRGIGGTAAGTSFVYTDLNGFNTWTGLTGTVSGTLPGDAVTVKQVYVDGKGNQVQPNLYTDAGTYQARLGELAGAAAANYYLDPALTRTSDVVIKPLPLNLYLPATLTSTYGTSPIFTVDTTTYPKDAVTYLISGAGLPSKALAVQAPSAQNNFKLNVVMDQLVDAGEYTYTITLGGARPGNYVLTGATSGTWVVKPKTLTWTVSAGSGQYGYYKDCDGFSCTSLVPGVDIGKPVYNGVIAGDDVGGNVVVLDLKGAPMTVDAKTPVGKYFEVVSGLTGAQAKNYTLATSGNLPGTLTINPLYLRYSTASSVLIEGQGQIGDAGKATLQTIGGVPLPNGETMPGAVVAIYAPYPANGYAQLGTQLGEGRYYYEAIGLIGQYAGNYRLLPVQNAARFNIPVSLNDIGVLDVYKDSRFGLPFVPAKDLPRLTAAQDPSLSTPIYSQTEQAGGAQLAGDSGGIGFMRTTGEENKPTPDFERPVTGNGTVVETHAGPTGAGAAAGGAAETDLVSGAVVVNTQASGVATALASFGVTGVTVSATADGHVDISISSGPVDASVGAQGEAGVDMKIGRTGVKIDADATVGAFAGGGVHGGLGGGLDGNVNLTSGTFAYATTSYNYGITNGVLTMTTGAHAGVGASTGVSGGFSGEGAAIQGGATVYSPGVVGGNFSVGAGYSNGVVSFSLDLGAQIGIGGLDLKLNFGVDVGKVGEMFSDMAHGGGPDIYQRQRDDDSHALSLKNDPAARFAYLSGNPDWNHDGDGSRDNAVFLQQYTDMLKATTKMVTDQQNWQKEFVNLLQTDPARAVEFSRNKPDFTGQYWDVQRQAFGLGVKLRVAAGQLVYANIPR